MTTILLITPNTSTRSTEMMLAVARPLLPPGITLRGATAACGPAMIVDEAGLAAAAEVIGIGRAEAAQVVAILMSAFGNPGAAELRKAVRVPVVGIREPAMRAAAAHGASFGIATTTPGLVRSIETGVHDLGLEDRFSGVRVPEGDPLALAEAAIACFEQDGAQTVVIGGGALPRPRRRARSRRHPPAAGPARAQRRLRGASASAARRRS